MTDIQAPIIDPRTLDSPGAVAPAASLLSLKDQLRAGTTVAPETARRGPGRPRKVAAPTSPTPPKGDTEKTEEDKAAAKKERIKELRTKLEGEWNDTLLMFLISNTPLTEGHLYRPGQAPKLTSSEKYTPLGEKLAINDFMATSLAHFAGELEYSKTGQSVSGAVTGGPVAMIIYGAFSFISVAMYAKGVKEVMDRVEMLQRAQMQHEQTQNTVDANGAMR